MNNAKDNPFIRKGLGPGDDVEMIKSEDQWPRWPLLPVKRHVNYDMECGLVFGSHLTTVVILNMWHKWTPEEYEAAKKYQYESVEKLVADGWIVD